MQETKWKGSKARNIVGGFKLFHHEADGRRNGVGVILEDEYAERVLEFEYTWKSGIQLQSTCYCFSLEDTKGA